MNLLTNEEVIAVSREVRKQLGKEMREKEEQDKKIEKDRQKKIHEEWAEYLRKEKELEDNMSSADQISRFCYGVFCQEYGPSIFILVILLFATLINSNN